MPYRYWESVLNGAGEQRMLTMSTEQMKNTEKAYQKNRRILAKLQQDLYGPKGIETTKRVAIDELDDQVAMLEFELNRMSREAQKNALLSENQDIRQAGSAGAARTVKLTGVHSDELDLIEEAEFEIMEDERETTKKNQLLADFGKNFHGYISRPGQNSSSMSEKKIKKEYSRVNQYYYQSNIKRVNPRVKRLLQVEKMKQEDVLNEEVVQFGKQQNPAFDHGNPDPLIRVLEKHDSKNRLSMNSEVAFGRPKIWRPSSVKRAGRKTALDDFNLLNVRLPRIVETKTRSIGHRDERGVFVSEQNKADLLAKLGILDTDQAGNEIARRGSVWDIGQVEDTFAPDGHIRTALTLPNNTQSEIEDVRKSRYVKPDRPRFFDIEITPSELFNSNTASRVIIDSASRISSAI